MAIADYHISRKTSYNQWLATDELTFCYWAQVSQGERKLPQTEDTRDNSSMLRLYLMFYVCMSNVIICVYITGINDKRIVTSFTTCHLLQAIGVFRLLPSIVSADYFAII